MGAHGLIQLRPHRADGAEGASGVLKNVAQLRTVQLAEFLGWQTKQIPAPVADLSLCNAALAAKKPHGRLDQCAFAGAVWSHQDVNFSFSDGEVHSAQDFFSFDGSV